MEGTPPWGRGPHGCSESWPSFRKARRVGNGVRHPTHTCEDSGAGGHTGWPVPRVSRCGPGGPGVAPLGDGAVRELPQEDLRSREDSVSKDLPGVDEKDAGRAGSKAKEVPCVGQGAAGRPQCGGSPRTPAVMTKTSVPVP